MSSFVWLRQCPLPRRRAWAPSCCSRIVSRVYVYLIEDCSCDRAVLKPPCRSRRASSPAIASSPLVPQATFPLPRVERVRCVKEWGVLPYISKRNMWLLKSHVTERIYSKKKKRNLIIKCALTAIQLLRITESICNLSAGSIHSIPLIRFLASWLTFDHSGLGKSYCPNRILFFIPGEIASPWLL